MKRKRLNTYTSYTVGCLIAWAILWIIVGTRSSSATRGHVLYFFLGWLVGWTSATIARFVYPPTARRRSA